jgi:hypothetical protein
MAIASCPHTRGEACAAGAYASRPRAARCLPVGKPLDLHSLPTCGVMRRRECEAECCKDTTPGGHRVVATVTYGTRPTINRRAAGVPCARPRRCEHLCDPAARLGIHGADLCSRTSGLYWLKRWWISERGARMARRAQTNVGPVDSTATASSSARQDMDAGAGTGALTITPSTKL